MIHGIRGSPTFSVPPTLCVSLVFSGCSCSKEMSNGSIYSAISSKQLPKYVWPNNFIGLKKKNTQKLKEKYVFLLFPNTHNYLLMGCLCPLVLNQIGPHTLIFCSTSILLFNTATAESPNSQR